MSVKFYGIGISNGIGIGKTFALNHEKIKISKEKIINTKLEINKLNNAIKRISKSIQNESDIIDAYIMLLNDPDLTKDVRNLILKEKINAPFAVQEGFKNTIKIFESMDDEYISERVSDIKQIQKDLLNELLNTSKNILSSIPKDTILVSKEILITDIAKINYKNLSGIITKSDGINSHVSILSRSFNIPAVTGIDNISFNKIKSNSNIIINGNTGEIILNPVEKEIENFEIKKKNFLIEQKSLEKFKNKNTVTKYNRKINLLLNAGSLDELNNAIEKGIDGIGLLRTEFLFINNKDFPNEEQQFNIYKNILIKMKNKPVAIRTFDIGGDKLIPGLKIKKEKNPALGIRGIRFCLRKKDLFETQLKALIKASIYGNLQIILPMITSIEEIKKVKKIINKIKKDLNIKSKIKLGIMIEVPSAAILCNELAKECDSFSIGTNDLTQYILAADRCNQDISYLYSCNHPAILKLIQYISTVSKDNNIDCSICGESIQNPKTLALFLKMGITSFSVSASNILKIRKEISLID